MDADVKAKQTQARRAELLFKLKQSEIGAAGVSPQPLGGQVDFRFFHRMLLISCCCLFSSSWLGA